MKSISLQEYYRIRFEDLTLKGSVGFVPTMGALHQGHLYLVEKAIAENDVVVVTIFVNPTQFNNPEDFNSYPKNLSADLTLLSSLENLYVICPELDEIYPKISAYQPMPLGHLGEIMEGEHRPGHFEGVVHVVHNLFDLIRPNKAYFGEKDFQQLTLIKKLVQHYKFDIDIISCPTQRAHNGLALSSRNQRLSATGLHAASAIYDMFQYVKKKKNTHSILEMKHWALHNLSEKGFQVEYIEFRDKINLEELRQWRENTMCFVAASLEGVRLIDNMLI